MSTLRLFPWKQGATLLLVVVVGAACSVFRQSRRPLQEHMAFHFSEISRVQDALVRGDLEAVREPARAIWLQTDHPDLPRGVDSPVHDLRRAAHDAASASTLEEAARSTGEMGAACARCHSAAAAGPTLTPEFPPLGTSDQDRMARHDWAARRMWEGIIADDDQVWLAGAQALADAPLVPAECGDCTELRELARDVHDLGIEASRVDEPMARAGLYGRLLTTCSGCHTRLESDGS